MGEPTLESVLKTARETSLRIFHETTREGADFLEASDVIIARAIHNAILATREQCAKVADEHAKTWGLAMGTPAIAIAAAIRALGSEKVEGGS